MGYFRRVGDQMTGSPVKVADYLVNPRLVGKNVRYKVVEIGETRVTLERESLGSDDSWGWDFSLSKKLTDVSTWPRWEAKK